MALGDEAIAAGMDVLSPTTDLVKDGADEITRTRDYIAQRTSAVTPIVKGGTGATTAAAARANLDVYSTAETLVNDSNNEIGVDWFSGRVHLRVDASNIGQVAVTSDLAGYQPAGNYVVQGGGDIHTGGGRFNSIGSRNFTVSVSYASAYMDGNNWLGITPSAERFKQDIEPFEYTLADAARIGRLVVTYRLKAAIEEQGEGASGEVGIIAERLLEAGYGEFVVYDSDGQVQSINYERMVVVAFGALADVEARLAALEGNNA